MKTRNKGFTLIELMVGVAILLIVIIATLGSFIYCMLLNESSKNIAMASNDAQYALEQIKNISFNNIPAYIQNYPSTQFANLPNESITFPNPVYTSTLDTIVVEITWNERNVQKTFTLTTCFAA
ncbi:MAG TPA: prepilin-type N-terminal cleavage/methylation domain-containing protein [Candidatus Omnitrophota bacterium]|nr:prepilin-type N-terminal cleavage/methylation domain-containing protein [Candidatus Omnitrophota bacterium]HPT39927.1 prepilin-type N-terminal cleavage/methylation domain-containing protein [Candidatus Omnitrophota bacterium]